MRNQSQTLIATIRAAVSEWRKREGWSRESVVDAIVQAHESIDGQAVTGIAFDPNTRDTFERMKVNADRVFRWLDDETKDSTLLPANFIPSILAALPMDLRIHVLNQVLRPLGVEARGSESVEGGTAFDVTSDLRAMMKESGEAQMALLGLSADSSIEELKKALREVEESREVDARTAQHIKAAIAAKGEPKLRAI
jgi:Putative bacterial toxin ydaT